MHVCRCLWRPEVSKDPQELGIQAFVSCLMWVLGSEPHDWAARALTHTEPSLHLLLMLLLRTEARVLSLREECPCWMCRTRSPESPRDSAEHTESIFTGIMGKAITISLTWSLSCVIDKQGRVSDRGLTHSKVEHTLSEEIGRLDFFNLINLIPFF